MIFQTTRPAPEYDYNPANPNPNIPTTVAVKAQLMQNYTTELLLAERYKAVAVGLDQLDENLDPNTHILAIRDSGDAAIEHFSYAISNGASWKRESWPLKSGQLALKIVTGQNQQARFVAFTLTTDNKIYYRQMGETVWTKCYEFPADASDIDFSAAQLAGQLQLGVSYSLGGNNSKAQWVDWQNGTVTDATLGYDRITSVAVGTLTLPRTSAAVGGMLVAGRRLQSDQTHLTFYAYGAGQASSYDFAPTDGNYTNLRILPNSDCEFAAVLDGNQITYCYGDGTRTLLEGIELRSFSLSGADSSVEGNVEPQLFAVNNDDQLLRVSRSAEIHSEWSDPIVLKEGIRALAVADRDGYVDMMTVSSAETNGALFEMHRAPASSNWHSAPIAIQDTDRARAGKQLAMAIDQIGQVGLPLLNLLKIETDTGKITRYIQKDPVHDLWSQQDYSLPNSKFADKIATTQTDNGRMLVACLSADKELFARSADEQSWRSLGYGLNREATSIILAAGQTDRGPRIYLGLNRQTYNTSMVYQIDATGESNPSWAENSDNYVEIYSIASGKAVMQSVLLTGIYVSAKRSHESEALIQWYPNDTHSIYADTPRTSATDVESYAQVAASVADEGMFFAIENRGATYQALIDFSRGFNMRVFPEDNIEQFVITLPYSDDDMYRQQIFALTQQGELKVSQQTNGLNWEAPTTLNTDRIGLAGVSTAFNDDRNLIGVADMGAQRIRHYMSRPAGWDTAHVRYVEAGESSTPSEFQSYVSQITVADVNGVGTPNASIYFAPNDSPVDVSVNGVLYRLDPHDPPMNLVTDSRGKATFTVLASSLTTTQLSVWTDFMPESDCLIVQPNGDQQSYLATVTQTQMQQAQTKNSSGQSSDLFSNPAVVTEDLVASINVAMGMCAEENSAEFKTQTTAATWLNRRSTPKAVRVAPRHDRHHFAYLQPNASTDQHFKIVFGHGQANAHQHLRLSRVEALAEMARMRTATPKLAEDSSEFDGSFGDIMQAAISHTIQINSIVASSQTAQAKSTGRLRSWFETAIEFVVEIVTDVVTGVSEFVTYLWEGIIEFVQDATDLVEAIFADMQIAFDALFGWLGQLFDWQDILNTQRQINQSILNVLNSLPPEIRACGPKIQNWFDNDPTALPTNSLSADGPSNATASAVNSTVETYNEPGIYGDTQGEFAAIDGDLPQSNWLMDQVQSLLDSVEFIRDFQEALAAAVQELVQRFMAIVSSSASQIQAELAALADQLLVQQGDLSLDELFALAINTTKAILDTLLASLVDAAVASLDTVADMLQAVIDMLATPLKIPLISDLYTTTINPDEDLTIIGFFSLLGALPATVTYKLIMQLKVGELLAPVVSSASDIENAAYQIVYDPLFTPVSNASSDIARKITDVSMSDTTFAITRFAMRTLATVCTTYSGIITLTQSQLDFFEAPNIITDPLSWASLFPSVIGQAAFYPLRWSPESVGDTAGFAVWLGEFVFPMITVAQLCTFNEAERAGFDVMTSIFGVFDCIGVISAGVAQGIEVDKSDALAVTQWVLSTTSCGVAAIVGTIDCVKGPAATGISAAYSPAAGMGALAIYDVVTNGFRIALDTTLTAVQLGDAFRDPS